MKTKDDIAKIERDGKTIVAQMKGSSGGKTLADYFFLLAQRELERCGNAEKEAQMRQTQGAYKALKKVAEMFSATE